MTERPPGMYVGELTDAATHERSGTTLGLNPDDFTTHGVIVGMTGSGKTGLGIVLLEEALTAGVPTLILDPKGDMGNLLLTFPNLAPDDFAPWVPAGQDAAGVADTWTKGLADWSVAPTEIATLRTGHRMSVYTPGSTSGIPLNIIGSLAPPTNSTGGSPDLEAIHDEVESLVQGLLGLVGVTSDPLSGREHVLMANIIELAWAAGETLDLATLLIRIQDPPLRKLGVIDVETFFPKPDRTALMMKLNGLLASPSFSAWGHGAPIDIESLLWSDDGTANAAVIYLAHLSDEERQMVVTRVLSKLVGWMRGQPGSTKLRVLVYMDEVYGFVPPTAMPPAKKPILTLFKQARAFGVGVVLATQNPVDLDYKAISNAGTWMIGRLQTERDKARLLDGMSSAAGTVDLATVDATISSLAKREFLLHTTGGKPPRTFGVRWAMSYLAGPISKDQVPRLPGQASAPAPEDAGGASSPRHREGVPTAPSTPSSAPVDAAEPPQDGQADTAGSSGAGGLAHDETPAMPAVAAGVPVRFLDPAAPWASTLGAVSGGRRLQACVAVRVNLLFDDTASGLRHTEQIEAVFAPLDQPRIDPAKAYSVDYDDRDLQTSAPAGAVFVLPSAPVNTKAYFNDVEASVKDYLFRSRHTTIYGNKSLKLYSRPGESQADFTARCDAAADAGADRDTDQIRQKLQLKIDRINEGIAADRQRAQQLEEEAAASRRNEAVSIGGSVLGAIFGGRKSARSISAAANRAATGRTRSQKADNRMEQALARIDEKMANIDDLQHQLAEEITDIVAHWSGLAADVVTLEIPLEKSDIGIEQVALVWVPTS
ncbi:MAG: DUF87 domain-containing protein [Microthrixaceae bacterium]